MLLLLLMSRFVRNSIYFARLAFIYPPFLFFYFTSLLYLVRCQSLIVIGII